MSSWHSKVFNLGEKCIEVIESAMVMLLIVLTVLALIFHSKRSNTSRT